jgi:hypothetical protein
MRYSVLGRLYAHNSTVAPAAPCADTFTASVGLMSVRFTAIDNRSRSQDAAAVLVGVGLAEALPDGDAALDADADALCEASAHGDALADEPEADGDAVGPLSTVKQFVHESEKPPPAVATVTS